jgi:S1-C subfamily serine protease
MGRSLTVLFLVVICFAPGVAAFDWAPIIDKVQKSLVYLETDEGSCTGIVIDTVKKYIQTDAHCDGPNLFADSMPTKLVSKDARKDLMVIEVKDLDDSYVALRLGRNPKTGQEALSAGYGYGLERPVFRRAMVSDEAMVIPELNGPYVALDAGILEGQSGGPVVDVNGDVVGISQMTNDKLGLAMGADSIRKRMGRFWAAK